jgi:signal transduction histidine kinase
LEVVKAHEKKGSVEAAFYSLDNELNFTFISAQAAELMNASAQSLIGRNIIESFPHLQNSILFLKLQSSLENEKSCSFEEYFSSRQIWYRISIYKEDQGYSVYLFDNTDSRRSQELRDEFITVTSHELKTPLTSVMAYSELLDEMNDLPQKAKHYITRIKENSMRMEVMILDLQDMQRLESGKLRFNFNPVDIDQFIATCVENFSHLAPGVTIQRHGSVRRRVVVDNARLEQVMMNLLNNAVKYSNNPEKVIVSVAEQSDAVSISVKDFGIGIPADKQQKIFERFYRVNERSSATGLGIGLYISNQIIHQLGGRISVTSEPGKGSVFSVHLPIG